MSMVPGPGEPAAEDWRAQSFKDLVDELFWSIGPVTGRPLIIAVDGRSASGKSTVAAAIAGVVDGSCVVHTDDVAWWHSFFGWDDVMLKGVLLPARSGQAVSYRPPAWDERNRDGCIAVPADSSLLLIEGVGSSRRAFSPYLDGAIWVQSDFGEATRRGIERDGGESARAFWDEWTAAENPFLQDDRPWDRADVVVCGTSDCFDIAINETTHVLRGYL